MGQASVTDGTQPPGTDDAVDTDARWKAMLVSLGNLESGLHKIQADLGQISAGLATVRTSLDTDDPESSAPSHPSYGCPTQWERPRMA